MSLFKDNFSKQSDLYVKHRPHYPAELYGYLSSLSPEHELAWDCGTGNGQAAIGLAEYYKQVVATDPSEQQIRNCLPHPKVIYHVEKAEASSLASGSADLLTIANALHWFDFDAFYTEVRRVLKPNGVIAAWAYGTPSVSPQVDKILLHYHDVTLNDYWQTENRYVEKGYQTIPFPFVAINTPQFSCERSMNLQDFIGFLNTWSATQRFISKNQHNPTEQVQNELQKVWQDPLEEKTVTWNLVLKAGR
jgi:SAM-dependent methyltransferase